MDGRKLAFAGVVAGGAGVLWWVSRQPDGGSLYMPTDLDAATGGSPGAAGSDYLSALSLAEDPSQSPTAKNPHSSASGLFQFLKATWTSLGGDWGTDPTQAFGGLTPSADEQYAMAQQLTDSNAALLQAAGVAVTNSSLYAMHILGSPAKVANLFNADPSTPLSSIMGSAASINPALGTTAGSALAYLAAKVG